ncbi:9472_t:CDS:2 [Diversispora eburnea]|uniref:9472_t:CDS:1 n=1 Tax=Diversispora eburnea TaxID=1213867 RepID=A0A9N9GXM5_9GLOM|nr:9472_t:CDS:2 [Diversispora eburnea]
MLLWEIAELKLPSEAVSHCSNDRIDLKEILRRLGQLNHELSSVHLSSLNLMAYDITK